MVNIYTVEDNYTKYIETTSSEIALQMAIQLQKEGKHAITIKAIPKALGKDA